MTKQTLLGEESRSKLLAGAKKITQAVAVTMGADGRCVLIGEAIYGNDGMINLPTKVTKDGYTVTKHFELGDPAENRGAMMIKEAAFKTVEQAGDATTCTCVLAEALITGGAELVGQGNNPQHIKKGIDKAVIDIVEQIKKRSTPVRGNLDRIRQVATVSANNDSSIGDLIAQAYDKIGDDGVVEVEAGNSVETKINLTEGFKIDRGFISPAFINNRTKNVCEFSKPLILLYERKITHHTQIEKAIDIANNKQRPLLIICEDAEQEGLAFLAMNNVQGRFRVCVIKSPAFADLRKEWMDDIALLTGATHVSDIKGVDVKKVQLSHFGEAEKVIVSKYETIIFEGKGNKDDIEKEVNELKMNLTQAKTEEEKFAIEKHIARLNGSIAVIEAGANTEVELKEKLDRIDDSVRATKAAISDGFIAGGGVSFLRVEPKEVDAKIKAGYDLVFEAIQKPFKQILINAGIDFEPILEEVKSKTGNIGYNVLTNKVEDMVEAGVIDSTKAICCALVNASSVAGMLLTSEAAIITTH